MSRMPWANFALIASIIAFFPVQMGLGFDHPLIDVMVHQGWSPIGMIGCVFLHGDIIHLLGNMLFLWVFGNAVCAKIGNGWYGIVFFVLALVSGTAGALINELPVIGASGAINGVVGLFLIWYPINNISCFYIFLRVGVLTVSSYWIILLWFAFDLAGLAMDDGQVAYMAHVAGISGGTVLGVVLLRIKWVEMTETELSLPDWLARRRSTPVRSSTERIAAAVVPPRPAIMREETPIELEPIDLEEEDGQA